MGGVRYGRIVRLVERQRQGQVRHAPPLLASSSSSLLSNLDIDPAKLKFLPFSVHVFLSRKEFY
jgi:hypothetical protein